MLPTKISLRDDIRKLTLPPNMVYVDLRNHAAKIFEIKHQHFLLQYEDDEKDFISLTNDEEWKEALQMGIHHQKLRLRIMLDNENPVHNIGLSRVEHVNMGVTSMMKNIPQDKLQQMISSVLTSPDAQKMLQQTLISTLPHLNSSVKSANTSSQPTKSQQAAAVQPKPVNNNAQTATANTKPAENTNNGGMYPPPPLMNSIGAIGMYPTNSYNPNQNQNRPPPTPGMYPVVLSPYSAYGSQLYASTTSYSRPDDDRRPMASFVRDVACFEGTKIQPKTLFFKTWRLQNNGKYAWPAQTKLVWEGGDSFGYKVESEVLQVSPGNTVDATVHLESPNIPGRYNSCWRLCSNGEKFGPRVWVDISVVDPQQMYPALQTNQQQQQTNPVVTAPPSHPATTSIHVTQPAVVVRKMGEVTNPEDLNANPVAQPLSESTSAKSLESGLQQLEDMGFKNREVNTKLMKEHNFEVLQVVQALLCQEISK